MFRQQLKILQQARVVQNQKLKMVRELYEQFVKVTMSELHIYPPNYFYLIFFLLIVIKSVRATLIPPSTCFSNSRTWRRWRGATTLFCRGHNKS